MRRLQARFRGALRFQRGGFRELCRGRGRTKRRGSGHPALLAAAAFLSGIDIGVLHELFCFLLLLFENRFCHQDFKKGPLLECTQSNRKRACLAQSSLVSEEPTSCSAVPEALFKGDWEKELQGIHDRVFSTTLLPEYPILKVFILQPSAS